MRVAVIAAYWTARLHHRLTEMILEVVSWISVLLQPRHDVQLQPES